MPLSKPSRQLTPLKTLVLTLLLGFLVGFSSVFWGCDKATDQTTAKSAEEELPQSSLAEEKPLPQASSAFSQLERGSIFTPPHLKANDASAPIVILFLGDSLTEGYELREEYSYPHVLGQEIAERGFTVNVINAGISGDTSSGGLLRLQWQLQNSNALPHIVMVALGSNDGLRGLKVENLQQNLQSIIALAQQNGIKVLLAGMQIPLNYGERYVQAFSKVYPSLAEKNNIPLIPFLLEGVAGEPQYNIEDGIHPNADGYAIIAKTVLPYLLSLVEQVSATLKQKNN